MTIMHLQVKQVEELMKIITIFVDSIPINVDTGDKRVAESEMYSEIFGVSFYRMQNVRVQL